MSNASRAPALCLHSLTVRQHKVLAAHNFEFLSPDTNRMFIMDDPAEIENQKH
jgi:hypothetical protein